nr:MAG TPA: hypothetical protein [Bacteriophage sp.]DAS14523.1 MAG TPA: hypothetical protein [Caudoviricetes sp.]
MLQSKKSSTLFTGAVSKGIAPIFIFRSYLSVALFLLQILDD